MTTLNAPHPAGKISDMMRALLASLNGPRHQLALEVFMFISLAHIMEHVFQSIQIFVLSWPRPLAGGVLGLVFPWLVTSEWLHYAYALIMLIGLIVLRPAFVGRARLWWNGALILQIWHHFEHLLLLWQALTRTTLFGSSVVTSILQLFIPRVELHLFYNAIVLLPMLAALWYHRFPPKGEEISTTCMCHRPRRRARATA